MKSVHGNVRLHHRPHVLGVDFYNAVHSPQVEQYALAVHQRQGKVFEPGRERLKEDAVFIADLNDFRYFLSVGRKEHGGGSYGMFGVEEELVAPDLIVGVHDDRFAGDIIRPDDVLQGFIFFIRQLHNVFSSPVLSNGFPDKLDDVIYLYFLSVFFSGIQEIALAPRAGADDCLGADVFRLS